MAEDYIAIIKTAKTVQELSAAIKLVLKPSNETKTKTAVVATPEELAYYRAIRRCAYLAASEIHAKLRSKHPSIDLPKLPPTRCTLKDILAWCEAVEKAMPKAGAK